MRTPAHLANAFEILQGRSTAAGFEYRTRTGGKTEVARDAKYIVALDEDGNAIATRTAPKTLDFLQAARRITANRIETVLGRGADMKKETHRQQVLFALPASTQPTLF